MAEEPQPLTGQVILSQPIHKLSTYKPEFCDEIISFFERMIEDSAERRMLESESFEERTKDTSPLQADATAKPDDKTPAPKPPERRQNRHQKWRFLYPELPSIAKFGGKIHASSGAIRNWRRQHPAFEEACQRAIDMLAAAVVDRGLNGIYEPAMCQFILVNWCGMKQRPGDEEAPPPAPPPEYRQLSTEQLNSVEQKLREAKAILQGMTVPAR